MLELEEFCLQVSAGPKQRPVQEFAANRADQALDERMGKRHIRNRLDFCHLKNSKIGLPLVESVQRIMIRAEVFRQYRSADRSLEHPAQSHSIDDARVSPEPDDAARKLVHHSSTQ
jgi:hypothetical protein